MAGESTFDWKSLGAVPPLALGRPRLEARVGTALASSVGRALARATDDSSQVSLRWDEDESLLAGVRVERPRPVFGAFRPSRSELLLRGEGGAAIGSLALEGRTAGEARAWLAAALTALASDPGGAPVELAVPTAGSLEMEFGKPDLGSLEVAAWLHDAAGLLGEIRAAAAPAASPVRCWPHHFDIATLISLDPEAPSESSRFIGVGLSMGDEATPQPYWYVNLWPAPIEPELPDLAVGTWNTEDWLGAKLTGEEIVAAGGARQQETDVRAFIGGAVGAAGVVLRSHHGPDGEKT